MIIVQDSGRKTSNAVTSLTTRSRFLMARNGVIMTKLKYHVFIDENFHFMDESERYSSGDFDSYSEAVDKCKEIIDEFLESAITANDTSESLYMCWLMYGENPFIAGGVEDMFSASQYTEQRCKELTR